MTKLPEDVKKALCCGNNDFRRCDVNAVKDIDNCEELANKYFDESMKHDELYQLICTNYHLDVC